MWLKSSDWAPGCSPHPPTSLLPATPPKVNLADSQAKQKQHKWAPLIEKAGRSKLHRCYEALLSHRAMGGLSRLIGAPCERATHYSHIVEFEKVREPQLPGLSCTVYSILQPKLSGSFFELSLPESTASFELSWACFQHHHHYYISITICISPFALYISIVID